MRELEFVQQGKNNCVIACVAMTAGMSIEEVEKIIPSFVPQENGVTTEDMCLIYRIIGVEYVLYHTPRLVYGRLYTVAVPSLNFDGGTHRIVIDWRFGDIKVLDPNEGVEGRKFYVNEDIEHNLCSFFDILEILI